MGVGDRWETTAGSVFDNIMDRKPRITRPGSDTRAQRPPSVIKELSGTGDQGVGPGSENDGFSENIGFPFFV